jgi:hypothetical protein
VIWSRWVDKPEILFIKLLSSFKENFMKTYTLNDVGTFMPGIEVSTRDNITGIWVSSHDNFAFAEIDSNNLPQIDDGLVMRCGIYESRLNNTQNKINYKLFNASVPDERCLIKARLHYHPDLKENWWKYITSKAKVIVESLSVESKNNRLFVLNEVLMILNRGDYVKVSLEDRKIYVIRYPNNGNLRLITLSRFYELEDMKRSECNF